MTDGSEEGAGCEAGVSECAHGEAGRGVLGGVEREVPRWLPPWRGCRHWPGGWRQRPRGSGGLGECGAEQEETSAIPEKAKSGSLGNGRLEVSLSYVSHC